MAVAYKAARLQGNLYLSQPRQSITVEWSVLKWTMVFGDRFFHFGNAGCETLKRCQARILVGGKRCRSDAVVLNR
jgi:hypothetical protein